VTAYSSPREAREKSAQALGFDASTVIRIGDEDFEIPSPAALDDDQQQRYNELKFEVESYDRDEDLTLPNGRVIKGDPLTPHRKDGQLVTPAYPVKLAIALWGNAKYQRYKKGGGSSNQILMEWQRMDRQFTEALAAAEK
jgi:hypothetical protein